MTFFFGLIAGVLVIFVGFMILRNTLKSKSRKRHGWQNPNYRKSETGESFSRSAPGVHGMGGGD